MGRPALAGNGNHPGRSPRRAPAWRGSLEHRDVHAFLPEPPADAKPGRARTDDDHSHGAAKVRIADAIRPPAVTKQRTPKTKAISPKLCGSANIRARPATVSRPSVKRPRDSTD